MTNPLKVLLVASECAPIVKIGDLGDVVGSLPKELQKLGFDARVILPLYKVVDIKKYNLKPLWREKRVKIRKGVFNIGLWSGTLPDSKTPIYLIENKKYLGSGDVYFRDKIVVNARARNFGVKANHKKEIERFAFFSDVVFLLLKDKLLPFLPDIVHAHDWHAGSLFLQLANSKLQIEKQRKKNKKRNKKSGLSVVLASNEMTIPKAVLTIHNLGSQGIGNGKNYLKEGILNADAITTVSATHAEEIKNKDYGFGLHSLLRKKQTLGILNGFDYESLRSFGEKDAYKLRFQEENGLKHGVSHPIFSMVSPFYDHKGVQWVIPIVPYVVELFDAQFIFLGTGEDDFEKALLNLAKRYPENVLTKIDSNEELAASIYASSDFFLMPSNIEPCGVRQMAAMRYGALPIARATGGLKDTIKDGKTGFLFEEKNEKALLKTIERALIIFADEESFSHMREQALEEDFSWKKPIAQYAKLYNELMTRRES